MPKQLPQSFLVVVDTNAFFSRDPAQIASDGFTAAWSECLKFGKLRLALPEIVKGERIYQMFRAAQNFRESAERNVELVAKVTASITVRLPGFTKIRQAVENRFDDWVTAMGIEIIPVPYSRINWPRVVNDAIWRVSPFIPPNEDKDVEKGFRDCLIVETLDELVQSNRGEQIVFITKDRLLREATIARFQPKRFAAYEDLSAFHAYLKLTHEQAEKVQNAIIQKIIQKAPSVFYTPDNSQCVYTKFNLGSRILQEFSAQLNVLAQLESENTNTDFEGFVPFSDEKIFIDSTEYEGSPSEATWGWKTRLRFVRVFRPQALGTMASTESPRKDTWERISELFAVDEIVRLAPFDVHWTARCDVQGNFSQLKVAGLTPLPHSQEIGFFKFKYGFPPNKLA